MTTQRESQQQRSRREGQELAGRRLEWRVKGSNRGNRDSNQRDRESSNDDRMRWRTTL